LTVLYDIHVQCVTTGSIHETGFVYFTIRTKQYEHSTYLENGIHEKVLLVKLVSILTSLIILQTIFSYKFYETLIDKIIVTNKVERTEIITVVVYCKVLLAFCGRNGQCLVR
jgi:hypothetical protein